MTFTEKCCCVVKLHSVVFSQFPHVKMENTFVFSRRAPAIRPQRRFRGLRQIDADHFRALVGRRPDVVSDEARQVRCLLSTWLSCCVNMSQSGFFMLVYCIL